MHYMIITIAHLKTSLVAVMARIQQAEGIEGIVIGSERERRFSTSASLQVLPSLAETEQDLRY